MQSDSFAFYFAHFCDGKQRDFWEQGHNPSVLSLSWISAQVRHSGQAQLSTSRIASTLEEHWNAF